MPRRYGVLWVFHLPGSAEVIGFKKRNLSAHSETVIFSGLIHAERSFSDQMFLSFFLVLGLFFFMFRTAKLIYNFRYCLIQNSLDLTRLFHSQNRRECRRKRQKRPFYGDDPHNLPLLDFLPRY